MRLFTRQQTRIRYFFLSSLPFFLNRVLYPLYGMIPSVFICIRSPFTLIQYYRFDLLHCSTVSFSLLACSHTKSLILYLNKINRTVHGNLQADKVTG